MLSNQRFEREFLRPRYWLLWIGLGMLYLLVLLPYPLIYRLGHGLGRIAMRLMKRRVKIARRNLALCFPAMLAAEREALIVKNFESVGMGLFEVGMAWFWPDWRIARWFKVSGMENMQLARQDGKGVLLIGLHFLTLELGARIFGMQNPGIGVHRPHNNKLMEWVQTRGRLRSNKFMIDRKDIKGMIRNLKQGKSCGTRPITITARKAACSHRSSPLKTPPRQPVPLFWRAWGGRRSCLSCRAACRMRRAMS